MEGDADNAFVVEAFGVLDVVDFDGAVLEFDAFEHLLHILACDRLVEFDLVDLVDHRGRMGELAGELAVVGEEEESGGVAVETADRIDTFAAGAVDKHHDGLAFLRVVDGGDITFRLVHQEVTFGFGAEGLTAVGDDVAGLHLIAHLGDNLTVDLDASSLNELVGFTTAANSSVGDIFVEADGVFWSVPGQGFIKSA